MTTRSACLRQDAFFPFEVPREWHVRVTKGLNERDMSIKSVFLPRGKCWFRLIPRSSDSISRQTFRIDVRPRARKINETRGTDIDKILPQKTVTNVQRGGKGYFYTL